MSYNFPGSAANLNLSQPFSGYFNDSISYGTGSNSNRRTDTGQHVPKTDNGEESAQPYLREPFDEAISHALNGFHATTMNQSTPDIQGYPRQAPPQSVQQYDAAPTTSIAMPVDYFTNPFWLVPARLKLPDGRMVSGTFGELYVRYDRAHEDIWKHYNAQHAKQIQNNQSAVSQHVNAQAMATATATATNTVRPTKGQGKQRRSTAVTHKPGAAAAAMSPIPAYGPDDDLDTPQKCRDYLAYIDPAEVHALEFNDDDWQDMLQNQKHEFIGQMFEALTHAYAQEPPPGITLTKKAREKYNKQQETQSSKVISLLQTAPQIKAAKALCSLLFDAAIYVHEVGVPKEVYDGYQWYTRKERQVDRKFRLDLQSVCSTRLEKIVSAIKYNKLIAMDVLEQTNFHRMARDPSFYLVEKFTYLQSNKARQENIDRHRNLDEQDALTGAQSNSAAALAAQTVVKRKREAIERSVVDVDSEDDYDEDDDMLNESDEEESEQSFKRMRR